MIPLFIYDSLVDEHFSNQRHIPHGGVDGIRLEDFSRLKLIGPGQMLKS